MTAVLVHARAELRAQWRTWLGLLVFIAVVGGAVIALWAGGRRTDTAYGRFLVEQRGADVEVFVSTDAGSLIREDQIERLPQVGASASVLALPVIEPQFVPVVATDGRYGDEVNRFKFLAGRPVRADRADEAVVGFLLAAQRHLHVGSVLTIHLLAGDPATVALRVVGIEAAPTEFPPRAATDALAIYLSPAFLDTPLGARAATAPGSNRFVAVRLRHGTADAAPFLAALQGEANGLVGSTTVADQTAHVQRSMHLQAVALWLAAAFVGLAGTLVLWQLLTRQGFEEVSKYPTLTALGMTPIQLTVSGAARVLVTAATGAAAAGVLAWLASPLLPLGTARTAEPHPGLVFDALPVLAGVAGVVVLVAVLGAAAQLRTTCRVARLESSATGLASSPSGPVLGLARLPLTLGIGARLALQSGRGRTAVPARTTIAATAIGIGSLAAAATFGSSLAHLLDSPELYGVTFDAHIEGNTMSTDVGPVVSALRSDPSVSAFAVGQTGAPLQVGDVTFGAQATTNIQGSIEPTVIEGRLPAGPDEILLGTKTMEDVHTGVGGTIDVAVAEVTKPMPMRVVGRGVLASMSATEQLGRGAILPPSAFDRMATTAPADFAVPPPGDVLVRFRPGVDRQRAVANLAARLEPGAFTVQIPVEPTDVADFGQVRNLPEILAGLLGVAGLMTIVHLQVSAIRRRRRDLAILKSLGMPPAKVSAAIFWQATTVGLVSTLLGLPLGVVAGRWMWNLLASQLGVVPQPQVPVLALAGLCAGVLVVVNAVAAAPAVVAGRVVPVAVLRAE
jgi:hypothetical protein